METEITFNDIPNVMKQLVDKIDKMQTQIDEMNNRSNVSKEDNHIPMNLKEACEFLRLKKSTMYYYIGRGEIPATKSGKSYIFFKDELIKWAESGRVNNVALTPEEMNAAITERNRRASKLGLF